MQLVVSTIFCFTSVLAAHAGLASVSAHGTVRGSLQPMSPLQIHQAVPSALAVSEVMAEPTPTTAGSNQASAAVSSQNERIPGVAKPLIKGQTLKQLFPKSPYYENKYAHKAFNWLAIGLGAAAVIVSLVGLALGQTSFVAIALGLIAVALLFFFLNPQNREYHKKF